MGVGATSGDQICALMPFWFRGLLQMRNQADPGTDLRLVNGRAVVGDSFKHLIAIDGGSGNPSTKFSVRKPSDNSPPFSPI